MEHNFFLIQNFVNNSYNENNIVNHDKKSMEFQNMLKNSFSDEQLIDLLIYTGYIPDLYPSDSSQETLYSKLIEVLVCEWAQRMGYDSKYVKQKASYEDITITVSNKVIVCDAKSFRLGRSQKAPNVKDFLKLEDIRKWLSRYNNKLGGLVIYPCRHEWTDSSDAYQYCTTKDAPTLMLPYKYLAFFLMYKSNFNPNDIEELWDYDRLFPKQLKKDMPNGNRKAYWNVINKEIIRITKVDEKQLEDFLNYSEKLINQCIQANLKVLFEKKHKIKEKIEKDVLDLNDIDELKKEMIRYRTSIETNNIDCLINRIYNFRIDQKNL